MTSDDDERRVLARARAQLSLSAADQARHEARLLAVLAPVAAPPVDPALAGATKAGVVGTQVSLIKWFAVALALGGAVGIGVTRGVLALRDEPLGAQVVAAVQGAAPLADPALAPSKADSNEVASRATVEPPDSRARTSQRADQGSRARIPPAP